jgi:hypothetical protein
MSGQKPTNIRNHPPAGTVKIPRFQPIQTAARSSQSAARSNKMVRSTPAKYFKWTPRAVDFLRKSQGIFIDRDIARLLGCSYWAVVNKRKELKFASSPRTDLTPVQRYSRLYCVSHSLVEFLGVENLDKMTEENRRRLLWNKS